MKNSVRENPVVSEVEISLPGGDRAKLKIHRTEKVFEPCLKAMASVIKDAGDDPDVTNGAEVVVEVKLLDSSSGGVLIKGGKGVGRVTKPGLPVSVGEAAINPVPKRMIKDAIKEVLSYEGFNGVALEITISVPEGERLAKKTLNPRLGIIGGISILGTTGIVKPLSSEAWTATISSSMDVARAVGCEDVVLSAGRRSEEAHMRKYSLPEEAYVMMGDYIAFSLMEAGRHGFKKVHLVAQWAKMLKIAMQTPQTHVRHGAIDTTKAKGFLESLCGVSLGRKKFNTAREIFEHINSVFSENERRRIYKGVCRAARRYAESFTKGAPVQSHLVSYGGEVIASDG